MTDKAVTEHRLAIALKALNAAKEHITELQGLVEGYTIRGDEANLLAAQVTMWASVQTDFKPNEVRDLAKSIYPDFMAIVGYGLPTNGFQCPKCDGPARYLVNVETGTTLLCPRCPHAWSIDQKDKTP